jgi:hypothetical protein
MSFMSFDYAMRAADAALQFQQGQSQNMRDTNQRVAEVGKGNAQRKDQLVRDKIQAEYEAVSAEIKADKAEKMMMLAEERKQNAAAATAIVTGFSLAGKMIDGGLFGLTKPLDDGSMKSLDDSYQLNHGEGAVQEGLVSAFPMHMNNVPGGNSENGGMVAFDKTNGSFHMARVNRVTGETGMQRMRPEMMASEIFDRVKNSPNPQDQALKSMISEGPPLMFKAEHFKMGADGGVQMSDELKGALFGPTGNGGFFASDSGKTLVGEQLTNPMPLSSVHGKTANSLMSILKTDSVRNSLGMSNDAVDRAEGHLTNQGALGQGGIGKSLSKSLFKPLASTMNDFLKLAQAYKEYDEEAKRMAEEYNAAKRQAGAARERLLKLNAQLEAGI